MMYTGCGPHLKTSARINMSMSGQEPRQAETMTSRSFVVFPTRDPKTIIIPNSSGASMSEQIFFLR